jgi:hypothetical protein
MVTPDKIPQDHPKRRPKKTQFEIANDLYGLVYQVYGPDGFPIPGEYRTESGHTWWYICFDQWPNPNPSYRDYLTEERARHQRIPRIWSESQQALMDKQWELEAKNLAYSMRLHEVETENQRLAERQYELEEENQRLGSSACWLRGEGLHFLPLDP